MSKKQFSVIGCRHGHIGVFVREMLELGHDCAGIYHQDEPALAREISAEFGLPYVEDRESLHAQQIHSVGSSAVNNEKIDLIEECEAHGKHDADSGIKQWKSSISFLPFMNQHAQVKKFR
jgi:hypothetical protein